jgi:hypothetical protein
MSIMSMKSGTFALFLLVGGALLVVQNASAQNSTPPATATRPSPNGPEQSSVPNSAPPASRTQTTGRTDQDPTVKDMNAKERDKIEREGK